MKGLAEELLEQIEKLRCEEDTHSQEVFTAGVKRDMVHRFRVNLEIILDHNKAVGETEQEREEGAQHE